MPDVTDLDRLWRAFRQLVLAEIRSVVGYSATYEYTITDTDGATVSATPNDTTLGLPALNKVPQHALSIGALKAVTGKLCHVVFIGGKRTAPRVTWCQPDDGDPVVRVGDNVNAGYLVLTTSPPGTINSYYPATTKGAVDAATQAASLTPPGLVLPLTGGKTTSGSSRVSSE